MIFYILSITLAISSTLVVFSRNPINGLLFLILSFFNAAGIFLLAGAEFLAMTLIIVYVGAVIVLFLFVVMMLDFDTQLLKEKLQPYQFISTFIALVVFAEMIMIFYLNSNIELERTAFNPNYISNTHRLGNVLYTQYAYIFQLSGLILLIAMISAIILTLQVKNHYKRQNLSCQLQRSPKNSLELVDVPSYSSMEKDNK